MIPMNEKVLKELCQFRGGAVAEWLKESRVDAMEKLSNVENPALRGEIRVLKELIEAIDAARSYLDKARASKPDMSKAF